MKRAIVTVVGRDNVGIVAKVSTHLANSNVNICDITQTIYQGFFNMMMIVDLESMSKEFALFACELEELGNDIGCTIKAQREEIFNKMHRI